MSLDNLKIPSTSLQIKLEAVAVPLEFGQFSTESSQNTPHSLPIRVRYGLYFVIWCFDLYSDSANAVLFEIWCYIGPRYNSTWLYHDSS